MHLRESEDRFYRAFDSAPIGMALALPTGRWLRVNSAFCAMLGYDEQEMLARDVHGITHPDDRDETRKLGLQLFAGEIPSYSYEKRYLHKSARIVHARVHVSPMMSRDGIPSYSIAQIEDITASRRSDEQFPACDRGCSNWNDPDGSNWHHYSRECAG